MRIEKIIENNEVTFFDMKPSKKNPEEFINNLKNEVKNKYSPIVRDTNKKVIELVKKYSKTKSYSGREIATILKVSEKLSGPVKTLVDDTLGLKKEYRNKNKYIFDAMFKAIEP